MTLLTASGLTKQYGSRTILDGMALTLAEAERIGVVGVNGSGKSTLLRILADVEQADTGHVATRRGITIGYLAQEPALDASSTIRQEMDSALVEHQRAIQAYQTVTQKLSTAADDAHTGLLAQLASLQQHIDFLGGYDLSHQIASTLTPLGITDLQRSVADLSGGERKRVAIGKVLLQRPEVLVLDEPTNHLDADTVAWLEDQLRRYPGGLLLVTHDRYFLDQVVDRIVEIEDGTLTSFPGQYQAYLEAKARQAEQETRSETNRQNLLRTELEWLRRGPKARGTKAKARTERAEKLRDQAGPRKQEATQINFGDPARLGKTILELKQISKEYEAGHPLIRNLDLQLERGERIGIIGPNGAGKTTLLKMIIGDVAPDQGQVVRGKNTVILYFDQGREQLDPAKTIWQEVADQGDFVTVGGRQMHVVSYLETFLFRPEIQRMPIGSLSGGERNRVLLAKLMKRSCNLLILDEPTNDLDLITLQVLEDALTRFHGCVITVTHDRFFLNKVSTAILAFEGHGQVVKYAGNYDTYQVLKAQRAAMMKSQAEAGGESAHRKVESRLKRRPKKLGWKETRELEALPAEIETTEEALGAIQKALGDPELYRTPDKVRDLNQQLQRLERVQHDQYERWEALEAKKEALELEDGDGSI